MKLNIKTGYLYGWLFILAFICLSSCGGGSSTTSTISDSSKVSSAITRPDTTIVKVNHFKKMNLITIKDDTGKKIENITKMVINDITTTIKLQETQHTKGNALIYCPAKMINNIPSIINAEITKGELTTAVKSLTQIVQQQEPNKTTEAITKDIKGDSIDIYEKMSVAIEFDSADFKQVSTDNDAVQSFDGKTSLQWNWIVKPLHSTEKSIITFKFYYANPTNNKLTYILEKTINVSVHVDARSFFEKWEDFLLDDPKTTITAILIPLITFLGGFFTGKKKQ